MVNYITERHRVLGVTGEKNDVGVGRSEEVVGRTH